MGYPNMNKRREMSEDECNAFDDWYAGLLSGDTDEGWEAKKAAAEQAVWWAVESFGITYQDVIRSWILVAGFLIEEGMDN